MNKTTIIPKRIPDLEKAVIKIVQDKINPFDDWQSNTKTRKREYVVCRQVVMTILNTVFTYNLGSCGAVFQKDHATAIHSVKTINNLCETNVSFRELMNEVNAEADKLPFKKRMRAGKGEPCHALRQSMTDYMNKIGVTQADVESWFVINANEQDIYFSVEEQKWILS